MKLNYDILLTLDTETIETGLEIIYKNAKSLSRSAEVLADQRKYPVATALQLLSIEELIKAQSLFFFLAGIRDKDFINYGFKKVKGYKNIHETRLHIASAFNNINKKLKKIEFDNQLKDLIESQMENLKPAKGEAVEDYIKRVGKKMADATHSLKIQSKLGVNTPSKRIIDKKDWLSNAQQVKEHCFYVDIEGSKWTYPSEIKRKEYLNAKKHNEESFRGITKTIEKFLKEEKNKRPYMLLSLKSTITPMLGK